MSLPFAFLLTFIAGGLSAWMVISMSRQTDQNRMDVIRKQIDSIGGYIRSIDLIDRKNCPFGDDYQDPDLVYKFYKISYDSKEALKEGWAILDMKQKWYGPSGAISTHWAWRL